MIGVIFIDLNAQEKRNIILSEKIIAKCSDLICNDKLDSIYSVINCTFFSDEDISLVKQKLIQEHGREMALSFLSEREFYQLDRFQNWAFQMCSN